MLGYERVMARFIVQVLNAVAVLQCAGDVETPTGGGDDGKAWRQFDPGGSQGQTCGENL